MKQYLINILIAFDAYVNVLLNGKPGETVSARAAVAARRGDVWGCVLCKFLDYLDKGHCTKAIIGDDQRAIDVTSDLENV